MCIMEDIYFRIQTESMNTKKSNIACYISKKSIERNSPKKEAK